MTPRRDVVLGVVVSVPVDDGNGSFSEFVMLVTAVSTAATTGALAPSRTVRACAAPATSAAPGSPDRANSCAAASAVCTAPDRSSSPAWNATAVVTLMASTDTTCTMLRAPVGVVGGPTG